MNSFTIIGGDLRLIYLAKLIAEESYNVYVFGQESYTNFNNNNIVLCNRLEEATEKSSFIISSIPFTKDGKTLYAPYSNKVILINDLLSKINNRKLFAGSVNESFIENAIKNNVKIIDLMKQEDLTILNTIATAEGAISDIILNTVKNIHGSNILILGFGRVSKELAIKLSALKANVTCAARKDEDYAWMETLGFNSININELGQNLNNYDVIINTVPKMILDYDRLKHVDKECLLLDLASKPGGIDQEACNRLGLKSIWSLAIPGKVSPLTSAQYIKNTIDKIIKEGDSN